MKPSNWWMLTADRFRRNAWNFNERRVELFPEAPMAAALAKEGVLDRFMKDKNIKEKNVKEKSKAAASEEA